MRHFMGNADFAHSQPILDTDQKTVHSPNVVEFDKECNALLKDKYVEMSQLFVTRHNEEIYFTQQFVKHIYAEMKVEE